MSRQLLTPSQKKTKQRIASRTTSPASAQTSQGGLHPIHRLQRTLGNRNVAKLIQAKRLTREGKIIGLQRKLTVGAADDQYEEEADRVARQVINMPNAVASNALRRGISPEVLPRSALPHGVIQRYAAREHVRFGEVESMITAVEKKHTVQPSSPIYHTVGAGESASKIAAQYGVSKDFLIARNAARFQVVDTPDGPRPVGFTKGDVLVLPGQTVAEVAAAAGVSEASVLNSNIVQTWTVPITLTEIKGVDRGRTVIVSTGQVEVTHGAWVSQAKGQKTITIKGVDFTYGQVIALGGDLYKTPEAMYDAPRKELEALKKLLVKEAANPSSVSDKDWNDATDGRYLKLAEVNTSHYAPSDRALTPPMSSSGVNHKSAWEKHHRLALETAQGGDKDKALGINAFADHFLTDAFSAGHLINKEDVMARFEQRFDAKLQEAFFHDVAYSAWSKVADVLDQYETVETHGGKHINISFPSYFQQLLQGIYNDKDGKGTVLNMVVLMIHDDLNRQSVEVENKKGDKWPLSGDGTLNDRSLGVGRQAVAQSQVNVLNSVSATGTLNFPALFKSVWDFTPRPTASRAKFIDQLISQTTNPANPSTVQAAVHIIVKNIQLIIEELVKRKKLKKA